MRLSLVIIAAAALGFAPAAAQNADDIANEPTPMAEPVDANAAVPTDVNATMAAPAPAPAPVETAAPEAPEEEEQEFPWGLLGLLGLLGFLGRRRSA